MLWLHIGLPKTGSSAIQAYLRQNRQALSDMGVFYAAGRNEDDDPNAISSGNGVRLARLMQGEASLSLAPGEDPMADFAPEFISRDHPVSLVSSENLAGAPLAAVRRLREEAIGDRPVRVLALVRDIYGHALSIWQQAIKRHGHDGGFADYCRGYQNPQVRVVDTYAEVFGPDAIEVVHYDTIAGDLIPGVFAAMGLAAPAAPPPPIINRSLTANETAVLAAWNRMNGGSQELSRRVSDRLIYAYPTRATTRVIDEEAAAMLVERHAGAVADFNARWFGGRPVLQAAPTARDRPQPGDEAPPADIWRDVAQAMLDVHAEQAAALREKESALLALKARERLRKGENAAAREMLTRALALNPDNRQAANLLAKAAGEGER